MPSLALLGLLSVGIGIELAVTAFLILRFLESREPQVRWWAVAFSLYTAHVVLETLAFIWPAARSLLWGGGLDELSPLLVFGGLLLTGLISLAYPLLRPQQIWLGVGAVLAGLFTIAFALGVLLRSWARGG